MSNELVHMDKFGPNTTRLLRKFILLFVAWHLLRSFLFSVHFKLLMRSDLSTYFAEYNLSCFDFEITSL